MMSRLQELLSLRVLHKNEVARSTHVTQLTGRRRGTPRPATADRHSSTTRSLSARAVERLIAEVVRVLRSLTAAEAAAVL
jgi:hypothetical protein